MLRPANNFHKCLITTPAHVVGEFSAEGLLVTHAWPEIATSSPSQHRSQPGSTKRTHLIVSFETEEEEDPSQSVVVPTYHWLGEFFASCLGVLFGKRFDHLGFVETLGLFCVPEYGDTRPIMTHHLGPYNSEPRADVGIELNLEKLELIEPLLRLRTPSKATEVFNTASFFYMRSLRTMEAQPESAYVDLVTAGEVLAGFFDFDDNEVYDAQMLSLLSEIRDRLPRGDKKARRLKKQMYQVRQRFRLTLRRLLNEDFFQHSEASEKFLALNEEEIDKAILGAYDLRSLYLHTGVRFGGWIARSFLASKAEKTVGRPVVGDKDYEKTIMRAPTFVGLERILRVCLIGFIHRELCPVHPSLD